MIHGGMVVHVMNGPKLHVTCSQWLFGDGGSCPCHGTMLVTAQAWIMAHDPWLKRKGLAFVDLTLQHAREAMEPPH